MVDVFLREDAMRELSIRSEDFENVVSLRIDGAETEEVEGGRYPSLDVVPDQSRSCSCYLHLHEWRWVGVALENIVVLIDWRCCEWDHRYRETIVAIS